MHEALSVLTNEKTKAAHRTAATLFESDIVPEQQRRELGSPIGPNASGPKKLWWAALRDALEILRGTPIENDTGKSGAHPEKVSDLRQRQRSEVWRWVRSRSHDVRSFEWICDELGLDSDYLREGLNEATGLDFTITPQEEAMETLRDQARRILRKELALMPAGCEFMVTELLPRIQKKYNQSITAPILTQAMKTLCVEGIAKVKEQGSRGVATLYVMPKKEKPAQILKNIEREDALMAQSPEEVAGHALPVREVTVTPAPRCPHCNSPYAGQETMQYGALQGGTYTLTWPDGQTASCYVDKEDTGTVYACVPCMRFFRRSTITIELPPREAADSPQTDRTREISRRLRHVEEVKHGGESSAGNSHPPVGGGS